MLYVCSVPYNSNHDNTETMLHYIIDVLHKKDRSNLSAKAWYDYKTIYNYEHIIILTEKELAERKLSTVKFHKGET